MVMSIQSPASPPSHLVLFFSVTAGQNGENLGSDEEQIVLFVYMLYDVTNNKVVTLQQHHVRPIRVDDISETVLTEECKIQTGLSVDAIKNAPPLEHVLDEFERFLYAKEVHPDHGGRPFCFCTDGQLHLRMCLVPEATNKNINLPSHFMQFFDLRKEFKKFYKSDRPINCINDMIDFLGLERDQSVDYGVKQCQEMASIIHRLINDGHVFAEPDVIKDKLESGVCGKDEIVDDETVVRARGLPWQSSDQDIARFFRGLNVARGGVALCLSPQGRRNGEALIRLESKEHRDLALRKHKHHIGQRYIEVYRATGEDFVGVAGGSSFEAQEFLSRHGDGGCQIIVRMRGLPYTCTADQVLDFFKHGLTSVEVLDGEQGVLFVHQADGRATGDAFVIFDSEEEAAKALSKHRQCIGSRYIELFKSTTAEVQQVLNRSLDPRVECQDVALAQIPPMFAQFPATGIPPGTLTLISNQQQLITSSTRKDCLRVRGLPLDCDVADILAFMGDYARLIVVAGIHLIYNATGGLSGEAFIQMNSENSAEVTALAKNKKLMHARNKKNYIEVIQITGEDMQLILNRGVPSTPLQNSIPSQVICSIPTSSPYLLPPPPPTTHLLPAPSQLVPANSQLVPAAAPRQFVAPSSQQFLSPDAALFTPMYSTQASLYAYPAPNMPQLSPQQSQVFNQSPLGAVIPAGHLPPGATFTHIPTASGPRTMTIAAPTGPSFAPYQPMQPILYWYPSPPVSPQSAYYIQALPTTVAIKGLPASFQPHDILRFLEGTFEISPEVTVLQNQDGQFTGDAYVVFASRVEAERAISDRNRKLLGSNLVEMFLT